MNPNLSGRQFTIPGALARPSAEYPVKGWRKNSDRVTAQQRLMGAGRGYDVHQDLSRTGLAPSLN